MFVLAALVNSFSVLTHACLQQNRQGLGLRLGLGLVLGLGLGFRARLGLGVGQGLGLWSGGVRIRIGERVSFGFRLDLGFFYPIFRHVEMLFSFPFFMLKHNRTIINVSFGLI